MPAARTHVLMKLIRLEGISNAMLDQYLQWRGHYADVYHRKQLTLRTELQVKRFYGQRVSDRPREELDAAEDAQVESESPSPSVT